MSVSFEEGKQALDEPSGPFGVGKGTGVVEDLEVRVGGDLEPQIGAFDRRRNGLTSPAEPQGKIEPAQSLAHRMVQVAR